MKDALVDLISFTKCFTQALLTSLILLRAEVGIIVVAGTFKSDVVFTMIFILLHFYTR